VKVFGADIAGSRVNVCVLDGTRADWAVVDTQRRFELSDPYAKTQIVGFRDLVLAFVAERGIELTAIRQRAERGKYAGGATSFKIEALLFLLPCDVRIVSPRSIASVLKKENPTKPGALRDYQERAFQTAYTALE
jgi:hypothetical protein